MSKIEQQKKNCIGDAAVESILKWFIVQWNPNICIGLYVYGIENFP
jgi:hypothetical protein